MIHSVYCFAVKKDSSKTTRILFSSLFESNLRQLGKFFFYKVWFFFLIFNISFNFIYSATRPLELQNSRISSDIQQPEQREGFREMTNAYSSSDMIPSVYAENVDFRYTWPSATGRRLPLCKTRRWSTVLLITISISILHAIPGTFDTKPSSTKRHSWSVL